MQDNKNVYAQQYLESNAFGFEDGAKKAEFHRKLCTVFLADKLLIKENKAEFLQIDDRLLIDEIRKATLELTDYLDEVIDFPLDRVPNYRKLVPKFLEKFEDLFEDWCAENPEVLSDISVNSLSVKICKRKFSLAYKAFESYGFVFVDGSANEGNDFLVVESALGQRVTVKPNMYFGCSFELSNLLTEGK